MKELNKYYVMPRIEAYELENESFIASSSVQRNPVSFGGSESGGGWSISKGSGSGTPIIEEELQ